MAFDTTPEFDAKADELIARYPVANRSAVMPLLHLVQERFGFIPDEAVKWVAQKLELELINVLEVVTFYPMFRRRPAGKHHIRVCRTLSCAMAGADRLMGKLCANARIHRPEHGAHGDSITVGEDGEFSIEYVECLASCGTGPVCMVDDDFYEGVKDDQVSALLGKYASPAPAPDPAR